MIAREERRLRAAFARALALALAGCGTTSADAPPADAGSDAADAAVTAAPDASAVEDASVDAPMIDPRCAGRLFQPDPPDTCGQYLRFPCGLPSGIAPRSSCFFSVNDCSSLCPGLNFNCHAIEPFCDPDAGAGVVTPDDAGAVVVDCSICSGSVGRVPAGLRPAPPPRAPSPLGAYFARAAHLEAASVYAFRRLARELSEHGAPGELVAACRDAARDEVRHARVMARLARRQGARYERPEVAALATRSLAEVARENAVEGCARETFGALLAQHQASRAGDPEVARAFARIADDETRHAALSWAIARWAEPRLDVETRRAIERTRASALRELAASGEECVEAGLPGAEVRAALAASLSRELFGAKARPLAA